MQVSAITHHSQPFTQCQEEANLEIVFLGRVVGISKWMQDTEVWKKALKEVPSYATYFDKRHHDVSIEL